MSGRLLGVDVGNSKTHVALATTDGRVLGVSETGGVSFGLRTPADIWAVVGSLVGGADIVDAAAFAVAGLDFAEQEAAFTDAAPVAWGPGRAGRPQVVCNDSFAVLRTAAERDGIAVVVGAGMNCVGRVGDRTVRFPALGAVSGDWGGGLMIAEAAVGAAARAVDGRGPATALREAVPAWLGLTDVTQVLRAVASGSLSRVELVGLARPVLELADAGDAACLALVRRQADEVVDLVRAAVDRLASHDGLAAPSDGPASPSDGPAAPSDGLLVALGGGVLRAGCSVLDERVHSRLAELPGRLRPVVVTAPAVVGALLLAADLLGADLDAEALARDVHARLPTP